MCELVLKNGTIVDVKNRKLIRGDLAVSDGKIIGIGTFSGKQEVDCQGKYLCPGFIDAMCILSPRWQRRWSLQRQSCPMERQRSLLIPMNWSM